MKKLGAIVTEGASRFGPRLALLEPDDGESCSYQQLELRSAALCARLQQAKLPADALIGVLQNKSISAVTTLFATLRAGMAYVPVDPQSSARRNAGIFTSCRVSAIWLDRGQGQELIDLLDCLVKRIEIEEEDVSLLLCDWSVPLLTDRAPGLAAVLYTSGSTGKPKGVQVSHGNALAFVDWCQDTFIIGCTDVCASIAPFHFDLSIFDLYVSLSAGATVLLLDQKTCQNPRLLARHFQDYTVSVCYATPTMLKLMLNHGQIDKADHSTLRLVLFAGEVFPLQPLGQLQKHWLSARFYNLYGPTETNVVTFRAIPQVIETQRRQPYPIGLPCAHAHCVILVADELREISPGLRGELLVSGPSVTPGYLGDAESSQRAFLAQDNRLYYRTGDLVQVTGEGELQFQGRLDRMVKRRGYRIELDEIEVALYALDNASGVAVCSRYEGDEVLIYAFVVPGAGQEPAAISELKRHCLQFLPKYFLPDKFIWSTELPLTSSGKVDYRQLMEEYQQ